MIVDDPNAHCTPPLDDLKKWVELRDDETKQNLQELELRKQDLISSKSSSSSALEKRRQREEKSASKDATDSVHDGAASVQTTAAPIAYTVTIQSRSSDLSWYHSQKATYESLAGAKEAGVWLYPTTHHEK